MTGAERSGGGAVPALGPCPPLHLRRLEVAVARDLRRSIFGVSLLVVVPWRLVAVVAVRAAYSSAGHAGGESGGRSRWEPADGGVGADDLPNKGGGPQIPLNP